MIDREKVMRGLEVCSSSGLLCPGKECPYNDHSLTCKYVLMRDALALMKEQEARVITLDDVCGGDECWIEYRYGGHGYADVYFSDTPDGTALVYRCRPAGDRRPETVWFHDYGKLWRGWTSRPTDEQRKAAAWDG